MHSHCPVDRFVYHQVEVNEKQRKHCVGEWTSKQHKFELNAERKTNHEERQREELKRNGVWNTLTHTSCAWSCLPTTYEWVNGCIHRSPAGVVLTNKTTIRGDDEKVVAIAYACHIFVYIDNEWNFFLNVPLVKMFVCTHECVVDNANVIYECAMVYQWLGQTAGVSIHFLFCCCDFSEQDCGFMSNWHGLALRIQRAKTRGGGGGELWFGLRLEYSPAI